VLTGPKAWLDHVGYKTEGIAVRPGRRADPGDRFLVGDIK
jgi:hypothetical protein